MTRRILVLSASVGAGHLRAAEAVTLALGELDPAAEVVHLDVLTLANKAFRRVYANAYMDLVNKAPHVLGYFYDMLDRPARGKRARLRVLLDRANLRKLNTMLKDEPWDVIVNTHFLPAGIVARRRRRGKMDVPHVTVTTDYDTHGLWINQPCDHYFTATAEGAAYLASWDVPREDITPSGIPIHPVFAREKDRGACLASQGLQGGRPVVLQLAGGFGTGPIERITRGVLEVEQPLELVVVTGRNAKAKTALEKVEAPARHRLKVLGFTTEIDELMAAADVVLSKPGGLTTSESLARGCAMAIVNPTPGQEDRNSDFLLENGAAIKINAMATLPLKLGSLLADAERPASLKRSARRIARPRAAYDVAQKVMGYAR